MKLVLFKESHYKQNKINTVTRLCSALLLQSKKLAVAFHLSTFSPLCFFVSNSRPSLHAEKETLQKETLPWRGQFINETDFKRLLNSLSLPCLTSLSPFIISLYGGGHELYSGLALLSEA